MNQIFAVASQGLFLYLGLALALVLLLMVLVAVLRSPRFKGWRGERAVQRTIRQQLNPLIYVDLHNVTLPTSDGSTQIDHLIFSPYGVFVLETKNYQGWIFGSEDQSSWTQQIFKKRSKFQNPLRQNYKHTKALQKLLKLDAAHVHSVIAFVGDCEFKTEMPPQVTKGDGFVRYIQSFGQVVWQPEEMQALLDTLEELRLQPGRATDKRHVAHVKELQAAKGQGKTTRRPRSTELVTPPVRAAVQSLEQLPVSDSGEALQDLTVPAATGVIAAPPAPPAVQALPAGAGMTPAVHEVAVCPQCEWPLRKLVMQRGPLAGQGIWRCTNTSGCSFVREAS